MNPDLDFESYLDYIPHLYEICAEFGYFDADGRFKNNEFEIKRVRRAIDLYCLDNDIPFDAYLKQLIDEYKQKYVARKKELKVMITTKKLEEFLDKTVPNSPPSTSDYPNDPKNDEKYDLSPHPGEPDCSYYDDDSDGPKY